MSVSKGKNFCIVITERVVKSKNKKGHPMSWRIKVVNFKLIVTNNRDLLRRGD